MAKFTGKGGEFQVNALTGSPPTAGWVAIGQVQEIGDLSITAEEVDVTTLDAGGYRDYIQGFKDPGEVELTVIFDPNLPTHGDVAGGLVGIFDSGQTLPCAIKLNSSAAGGFSYLTFNAFIRDMTYGAINADDPQTISPVFRLAGPVTLSDTAPV